MASKRSAFPPTPAGIAAECHGLILFGWRALFSQSKELVEGAPKTVAKGMVKEDAEELAKKLTEAGGTAALE